LKWNGTHQLLVYAEGVNTCGGRISTMKKNTEALVVASKGTNLEVNAEKDRCIFMFREQHARQNHKIQTGNTYVESLEQYRLGKPNKNIPLMKKLRAD